MKTVKEVTYRIGAQEHVPREYDGREITEMTTQNFDEWLTETQTLIGKISVLEFKILRGAQ